jgi:clan AA aspartic protease (TIGR02281 family)
MMASRFVFLCALQLALLSASALAQEAPVTDCDIHAASDQDPQHKSTGISFDKINPGLAVPACEAAVQQYPDSSRLNYQLGRAYQKANDFRAAMAQYRKAADRGNALAQNNIGAMHSNGQGVPQDYAEALKWYRKAADQGNALAQANLGLMYHNGQGVPQDYAEALKWFRKAADQGNALAQASLGWMYHNGQGVPRDYAEALKWFRKAADQGNALAQANLGWMYHNGQGVPQDYAEALKWFRKAADQGNAVAQASLGWMYHNGQGVPQDYAEALKWYRKAADQGNALAQANLGWMYHNGQGVPRDYAEALKWYRKAADQGNALAQANLGWMYFHGQGVPQDFVQAYMWLSLAVPQFADKKNRDLAVKERDSVASKMTPGQIAEAQRLARAFTPSTSPSTASNRNPFSQARVPMKIAGGIFVVPVEINGTMMLDFAVDSGATDVSVPADVFSALTRTGTVNASDIVGEQTYVLADGSEVKSTTFTIRSLKVGSMIVENVRGSVASARGALLLGQSFLGRFRSWSVDNTQHVLLLEPQ